MKYLKLKFNFEIKSLDINLQYKNIDTSLIYQQFKVNNDKEEENNNDDNQKDNSDLNEKKIILNNNEENKIEEEIEIKANTENIPNEEENNINEEKIKNDYKEELPLEEVEQANNIIYNNDEENEETHEKDEEEKEVVFYENKIDEKEIDDKKNNENDSEIKGENNNLDENEEKFELNNDEENKEEYEENEKSIDYIEEQKENMKDDFIENKEILIEKESNEHNDKINDNLKENEIINEENDDNNFDKYNIYNNKTEEKLKDDKINELLKKILSLEKEISFLKKENSTLKEENKKIKNEKISFEKESNYHKKEKESLKKEISHIKEENESLKKENNGLKKENNSLKNENDSYKNKLAKANLTEERLKKSNKEKNDLKVELQKLKNENKKNKSPEKILNNKKKNFIVNIEDTLKRQKTINIESDFNYLDLILDENYIKDEDNDNKNQIINLQENKTKKNDIETNLNFQSKPPINLKISKTLTQSSYVRFSLDNAFDAFTTISGEILLVYATKFKSIECFDIVKQKFKKTVLNAHNSLILLIKYYCPIYLNKELILSSSNNPDYCVKIWDIQNWSCIFNLNKIYEKGNMLAVCLHFDEYQKEGYICTSNDFGYIKIWSMDGKFIKNVNRTENNETYFLDTFYDATEFKYYLISGEMKCVKSFELNTHQLFRTYIDTNSFAEHLSGFLYKNMGSVELVECEFYGYIRIWNFHSGNLIKKIEVCKRIPLVSMCLWNKNYLLVSCVDLSPAWNPDPES